MTGLEFFTILVLCALVIMVLTVWNLIDSMNKGIGTLSNRMSGVNEILMATKHRVDATAHKMKSMDMDIKVLANCARDDHVYEHGILKAPAGPCYTLQQVTSQSHAVTGEAASWLAFSKTCAQVIAQVIAQGDRREGDRRKGTMYDTGHYGKRRVNRDRRNTV